MLSLTFLAEHWVDLIFGLISAGLLGYFRYLTKKFKQYEALIAEKDNEKTKEMIDKELAPIQQELEEEEKKLDAVKEYFKSQIIEQCEIFLEKGYMTPKDYNSLTENWKIYHGGLHGNSQGEDYYRKAIELPIHENEKEGSN